MESIHLNLHTAALIGNIQICALGYVLQKNLYEEESETLNCKLPKKNEQKVK